MGKWEMVRFGITDNLAWLIGSRIYIAIESEGGKSIFVVLDEKTAKKLTKDLHGELEILERRRRNKACQALKEMFK